MVNKNGVDEKVRRNREKENDGYCSMPLVLSFGRATRKVAEEDRGARRTLTHSRTATQRVACGSSSVQATVRKKKEGREEKRKARNRPFRA